MDGWQIKEINVWLLKFKDLWGEFCWHSFYPLLLEQSVYFIQNIQYNHCENFHSIYVSVQSWEAFFPAKSKMLTIYHPTCVDICELNRLNMLVVCLNECSWCLEKGEAQQMWAVFAVSAVSGKSHQGAWVHQGMNAYANRHSHTVLEIIIIIRKFGYFFSLNIFSLFPLYSLHLLW